MKDLDNLSKESIMESVLNYGNFNDVQKMIAILGIDEVAKIFKQQKKIIKDVKKIFHNEFNEKTFREQLAYFKDIDYAEKINYKENYFASDNIIKKKNN